MPPQLLSFRIEKDLRGDHSDLVFYGCIPVFLLPDIDKFNRKHALILLCQFIQNRGHLLAGHTFMGAEIHQFRQRRFLFTGPGRNRKKA